MKKILLFSTLAFLFFSSCKKEVTEVQKVDQAFSAVYDIAPSAWTTTNNGLSYTAQLNIPELDDIIYQNGAVLVYLSFPEPIIMKRFRKYLMALLMAQFIQMDMSVLI